MNYYDYDITYNNPLTNGRYEAISNALSIFIILISIISIVSMWKLFQKANKPGWAAIIPFYNIYILFDIAWGSGIYSLLLFLAIIPAIGSLAVVIIVIITYVKLAKAFGKSELFAVGLIFLNTIFIAILAFDSSTYLSTSETGANKEDNSMPRGKSYCHNCGAELTSDNTICPICGTPKAN